ncbi:hypothetical protein ACVWYG_000021 [Pedobacter sp. UYEF25]
MIQLQSIFFMKNEQDPAEKDNKEGKKVKDNEYTPQEQKFADGEGSKLDKLIDKQEKEEGK